MMPGLAVRLRASFKETTPLGRRTSRSRSGKLGHAHNALSPPKKINGRPKRRRGSDFPEEDNSRKKDCLAKNQPIVSLTRMTPESPVATTSQNENLSDEMTSDPKLKNLCPYERERLRNIKENAKFLNALKLLETASVLRSSTKNQNKSRRIKRQKIVKPVGETSIRRSMRLQRIDVSGVPLPCIPTPPEPSVETNPMKPPGPLEMIPVNNKDDHATFESFLKTWGSISQEVASTSMTCKSGDVNRYVWRLREMDLKENYVRKVVRRRVLSVAVHPSETRTLIAAGDLQGQVGLWDLDHQSPDGGVYAFPVHSQTVGCMHFSPSNPAHLVSLSYDGTIRCGDVTQLVFDEIYRDAEDRFSAFDFLSPDAAVLLVSHWDAHLSLVDRRTPGTSYEHRTSLSMPRARTVNVHPVNRNLCVVAGARDVCIYDVRKLQQKRTQAVLSLIGHTKSVASAYFSPGTGNRILTTCADDQIRVYDSNLSSTAPPLTMLRHNNNTGRWLTRFRAVWDPKQEDCFVIGSLLRPRRIEVYHENGKRLHCFEDSEYLSSVCSINAMHPSRSLLVGGNSSGRLHVFL